MQARRSLLAGVMLALASCGQGGSEGSARYCEHGDPELGTCDQDDGPAAPSSPVAKAADAAAFDKYAPWNSELPEVRRTGSGLEYVVLASGPAGGVSPIQDQQAEVFYEGRLNAGGPAFDSAFERGTPATLDLAGVVPGAAEVLQLMKPGDRWMIYIPSSLGYGERGTPGGPSPSNADLVFEIEMVAVR